MEELDGAVRAAMDARSRALKALEETGTVATDYIPMPHAKRRAMQLKIAAYNRKWRMAYGAFDGE